MVEITREAYEQGRVRRRDGGEFRIHAFADETDSGFIIGESQINDVIQPTHWTKDGNCYGLGAVRCNLILAPRTRTVYVNLYYASDLSPLPGECVTGHIFKKPSDAHMQANVNAKLLCMAVPIEIED